VELIETEQKPVPVEPEPRYVPQTASLPVQKSEHGQTWLRTLAAILAALVLIVLIVLLARWIYHKTHHTVAPTPTTGQQSPARPASNTQSGAQPASGGSSAAQPSPSPSGSAANPPIANTGPGNVVAIFAGVSLAAAGLHYIITVRRFSKNDA
jgi:hypothetical protein